MTLLDFQRQLIASLNDTEEVLSDTSDEEPPKKKVVKKEAAPRHTNVDDDQRLYSVSTPRNSICREWWAEMPSMKEGDVWSVARGAIHSAKRATDSSVYALMYTKVATIFITH